MQATSSRYIGRVRDSVKLRSWSLALPGTLDSLIVFGRTRLLPRHYRHSLDGPREAVFVRGRPADLLQRSIQLMPNFAPGQ